MHKQQKVDYGYDVPQVVLICSLVAAGLIFWCFLLYYALHAKAPLITWCMIIVLLASALAALYPVFSIIYGGRLLKFRERDWLLDLLQIQGTESILDVGCGRGLLLIGAAKKLTTGRAVGIDIWSTADQSSNSPLATLENARIEGVADKVDIITADARQMPFEDASFDMVISSWALHTIAGSQEREKALVEIMRVLKPGGTVAILDIMAIAQYVAFFKAHFVDVEQLGPRYTFGNRTYLVKARKKRLSN